MAQLSDDCLAFGDLVSVDAAWALIAERVRPVAEVERVALDAADGRVLAEAVVAPIPLPPFDNAAVDGYAVRHADLAADGTRLPVVGRLAAGGVPVAAAPGTATRIFTGAPMPPGLDTVFMQEDVEVTGGDVLLPAGLARGANRRLAGEDLAAGAPALPVGRRLLPQDVALLAALGLDGVQVRRRVRVGVFSTGDEVAAGGVLGPGRLHDANRPMLLALLGRLGCRASDLGVMRDDREAVARALAEAAPDHDLLLTSGGVSAGEEDHVRGAVEAAGGHLAFWRLAIKPGRPVAMGEVGEAAFIGLPGNPVAVFVTFARIARAVIARLAGERLDPPRALPVRAGFAYRKKAGRREYVRVRLGEIRDGLAVATKHPRDGAGVITSLTETDGLVELGEDVRAVATGDVVGFIPYAALVA